MSINREITTPWIYIQALNKVLANFSHIIVDTCHNIRIIWQWQNSNIGIQVLQDPHLWPAYAFFSIVNGSCCSCFLPFIINTISNPMGKKWSNSDPLKCNRNLNHALDIVAKGEKKNVKKIHQISLENNLKLEKCKIHQMYNHDIWNS
jgi:hypothetical protein